MVKVLRSQVFDLYLFAVTCFLGDLIKLYFDQTIHRCSRHSRVMSFFVNLVSKV